MEYGGSWKMTGVEFLSRNWLVEVLQLVALLKHPAWQDIWLKIPKSWKLVAVAVEGAWPSTSG